MLDTLEIQIHKTPKSRLQEIDFDNLIFGRTFSDHMFTADYQDHNWQNLLIQPYSSLSLSPALMALHYGQSIFEGMKAYRTVENEIVLFRPHENWKRMNVSAERMCMAQLPEEVFIGGLQNLVALDKDWVPNRPNYSLYLRPFMFASDEYIGVKPSDTYKFVIFTCPVGAYYSGAIKVKVEQHYVRAAAGGTGFAKAAGNYAASLYPAKLAQDEGYQQIIWTDAKEHRYVEESGTMNLIFVINGKVVTPPTDDKILHGITRKSVLELAQDWGMTVEERYISMEEILDALQSNQLQEAFGVGTAAVVTPIETIGYLQKDYQLPTFNEDCFGFKAKKYLTDLCKGLVEDKFDWIFKVA
ncbi:MAG: branched-chain amino acid aminotransferase [Microscillaceae bacterium]|nr:branched-chain amino acid aminotransferase [Microscillaceae bacterium]